MNDADLPLIESTSLGPLEVGERLIALHNSDRPDRHAEAIKLIADDAIDHAALPGTAAGVKGWRQKWEMSDKAFKTHINIVKTVVTGDTVSHLYEVDGKHVGDFMGTPATGRTYRVTGMDMFRVKEGKIVEHWAFMDQSSLLKQLGIKSES